MTASRAGALALTALLAGAAGTSFGPVFGLAPLAGVLAVAALAPAALAALWSAGRRRLPLWAAVPASLACWFLAAGATLLRHSELAGVLPTAATMAAARRAVSDSWWQLLTTILPAPATPQLMLGVHLLVWAGSMAAGETVLRSRRVLPALLPAAGILLAGTAFGVDGPGSGVVAAGAVVMLGGLLVVVRQAGRGLDGRAWRHAGAGVVIVAVAAVLTVMAGPRLPLASARAPFDPRRYVHPVARVQALTSPLDEVSLWLAQPRTPLFTVRAPVPEDWRLAVLDRFDGQTWTDPASFTDTGGRIPPAGSGPAGRAVTQTVPIKARPGPWLPAAGRPAVITGVAASADPAAGVLLDREPLRPGARYRLTSRVWAPTRGELRDAAAAAGAPARADLALPPHLPRVIASTAQAATAGAASPFGQAAMLASYLYRSEEFSPAAPPGHSSGAISYFLSVSHRGTSEQFATAYALMARSLGLPSRVVVGFRPGIQLAPGSWQVDGADALVWPEVNFARIGWVPFFPTPARPGKGAAGGVPAGQTAAQHRLEQRIASTGTQRVRARHAPGAGSARRRPQPRAPASRSPFPLILIAAVAWLGAGYLAAAGLIPVWRRRRRHRGDLPAQVVGAWLETVDSLRRSGVRCGPADSAPEVAALGAGRLGTAVLPALLSLASLADHATFAQVPLGAGAGEQAWRHCAAVRRAARARTTLRRRLVAAVSPGRLWRP